MSYISSQQLYPSMVLSLAAAGIGAGYALVGALPNSARIINFQNLTDQDVMLSFDGFNDHLPVPARSFVLLDATANKTEPNAAFFCLIGQEFYVRDLSGAPSTGNFYISSFYGIDK